jgi:hypothetical protein
MARRILSLVVLGLAACSAPSLSDAGAHDDAGTSGSDAGSQLEDAGLATDAGSISDAGSLTDAGLPDAGRSCVAQTDCPCFSNDDCPADMTCHSFDSTGTQVFCVPGARGTGAAGVTCTGETDCQSALCVDVSNGRMACSKLCTQLADCPNPPFTQCLFIGFGVNASICAP